MENSLVFLPFLNFNFFYGSEALNALFLTTNPNKRDEQEPFHKLNAILC